MRERAFPLGEPEHDIVMTGAWQWHEADRAAARHGRGHVGFTLPLELVGLAWRVRDDKRHGVLRRPRDRSAADERDERAARHSITSSARARKDSAIAMPIAFAVLLLITSSNFVGCSMGMSLGCLPCKIFCMSLVP